MNPSRLVLILCLSLGATPSSVRADDAQQSPSLVAETGRAVQVSRGGSARSFKIASAILKEERHVLVVLPASYGDSAANRKYPVLVVADGEYLTPVVAVVSDELARNGQVPESVIVGIENVRLPNAEAENNKRVYDLTPPGLSVSGSNLKQGGDVFLDFIEKELLPALDRQFRTGGPRTFVGVSSGGVLATYAAATRSTYSAVVSLDAPLSTGSEWLAAKLFERAAAGGRPVRYASVEAVYGWPEAAWKRFVAAAPGTWRLYREKLQMEGHETMQMLGAYLALRQLFADYSRFTAPQGASTGVLPYYAKVGDALGASVIPPKRVLRDLVNDLLGEGRGAAAREAYDMLVSGYGAPPDGARLLAEIADADRRPPPAETVESLLATPFPTPEETRAFIGEWVGDITMRVDSPRTGATRLRIKVIDGRVVGETVNQTPEGEVVRRWDYLRITPRGMTWGRLNERLPRGVMLFVGTLEGDVLSGQGQFAGMRLENPPPPLQFRFQRVRR
jgi:hypothetical protein